MSNDDQNGIDYSMLQSRLGYKLRRAQLVYFDVFFEACAQEGITPGLFSILAIIYHNPGLTQSAVSTALDVDRSAMVAAIDKLESMEVVERRKSKNDRRSYALYLTDKGKEFTERLNRKVAAGEDNFDSFMKEGEREWLLDLLDRIIAARKGG
ncbi:MarR family transcriptional regulator [Halomonas sp. MCCC 1A17488]|uniref:MarR family transcriptional regulator n=1 Tax=Billgrantia bachuensis TaxID=2717286 RepID=A0ABX0Q040_9GAMM|nr:MULTISPECIES: MarR family transcriptional regulator [Halomonas]MCE8018404.1 MarR family transcriptional regulator [Halomonas sp. MCCC 1A17488]MCG3241737.1 MarR family transcriptional regulator [Halomonas sp. MCCC 1A17488]NIC07164.1 MarR family transcriptional regulator [Halomonas bachuensis]QPP49236.1 MarR family transcriptional regulator [Halomonas sp. SS10-MC5]